MIIRYIKRYTKKILDKLILAERSPQKLTLSFCLGIYISFSPYITLQTWLIFPISWLLGLNPTVAVSTLYIISNPVTFVPIMVSSYLFGQWFLVSLLKINAIEYNPSWMDWFNNFLNKYINLKSYIGSNLCFWCFFVGGNVLGLLLATILYPFIKPLFAKLIQQFEKLETK